MRMVLLEACSAQLMGYVLGSLVASGTVEYASSRHVDARRGSSDKELLIAKGPSVLMGPSRHPPGPELTFVAVPHCVPGRLRSRFPLQGFELAV